MRRIPSTHPPRKSRTIKRPFTELRLRELFAARKGLRTYWRHDVDVSLEAARKMVMLEAECDVWAVYFVMTTSPFYTPDEAIMFASFASDYGHRIGWHIDPRDWPPRRASRKPGHCFNGARVSWHCPRETELWRSFDGIISAYDPSWQYRYYADSRGAFAYGDPEDWPTPEVPIQINLHPEWWFDPEWHTRVKDKVYAEFFHEPKERLLV